MQLQHHQQPSTSLLPYQPIKFVFTQTIGSLLDKFKQIIDPYTWTYQDILQPRTINNLSKIEYYLFHIAPIYNWLRQVGSQVLEKYLEDRHKGQQNRKNNIVGKFNNHNQSFGNNNSAKQIYKNFDKRVLLSQLKHYISQWQIVKLCACAKVKIITTRINDHQNSNTKSNHIKNPINQQQQPKLLCTHMIKKQKFTTEYTINNFSSSSTKLQCLKHYCEQCQRQVPVKTEITKYPFAPLLTKYYGKDLVIDVGSSGKKIEYQLVIVYGVERVFVKSSGGVWYQVGKEEKRVVSFQKVDVKGGEVFVYQQKIEARKLLRKAEAMLKSETKHKLLGNLKHYDEESQEQLFNLPKPYIPSLHPKKPILNQPQVQVQSIPQDQPLQQLCKAPLPIIMSKKRSDKKLFKQYKKTVQQLLPKPRQKDQYEKDYDKGKTKKIHKNRQVFRTADFFDLYNKRKLMEKEGVEGERKEGDQAEGDKGERKEVGGKNEKRGDEMQDEGEDNNKLDMYEGKRDDRSRYRGFSRGRGGRGRGGHSWRDNGNSSKEGHGKFSSDTKDGKFEKNKKFNNGRRFTNKFNNREKKNLKK